MTPRDLTRVLGCGLYCTALFHLSVLQSATGDVLTIQRVLQKLGATERQIADLSRPQLPVPTTAYIRIKREGATTHDTTATTHNTTATSNETTSNATTDSVSTEASNATNLLTAAAVSTSVNISSSNVAKAFTIVPLIYDESSDLDDPKVGVGSALSRKPKYSLPTLPPFDRDIVANLPERQGEDEAIVETHPNLLHPPFTTYMLIVTAPCVVGWCLLIFVCLWICRPNSPLYRELLKRLIEHSYMKQKSVLFSATVLAADRHAPVVDVGEGPSNKKA